MPEKTGKRQAASGNRTLKVRQVKSRISAQPVHRRTLDALGLRRHQRTVEIPDSPSVRGMLFQVRHLVEVIEK